MLISVLFYANFLNDQLVFYLSYAVTLSGFVQLIFLYIFVKKFYTPKIIFKIKIDQKVKKFFKKLLPSIFSSGVTQINILVGTIIASFQASAVSYLYYADRIYQINLAIAGIAIGTVILPQLSKYVQNNKKEEITFIQNKALELSLFLSIPASIALLIASEQIVSALFGYGSFDENGVKNSAKALFFFSLGLPAFSLIKFFSCFLFARNNTKIPFYISLDSVILNILISIFYFNSVGFIIIPIATSISSWFNSLLLFVYLKKDDLFNFNLLFINRFIRIILATSVMGVFFNYLINFFGNYLAFDQNFKSAYLIGTILLALILYFTNFCFIKYFY
jgi:putative peptidoglycan lipid II flippase